MDVRRYKDLVAFKNNAQLGSVVAFHSTNLEVADISEDAFNIMLPIDLSNALKPIDFSINKIENLDIQSELYDWNEEKNTAAKSGKIEFGIRTITINVNQICNLKCNYCAAGGDGTFGEPISKISIEKTLPQLKFFLESLKPKSKFSITFLGGEPLLYPEAIEAIYNYVEESCIAFDITAAMTIVTNGTLFNDKIISMLRKMKIHITISIDGVKEINDIARPTKNGSSSTDLITTGLEEFTNSRGQILSIGFAAVFTSENTNILANYEYLNSLNPDWVEFVFGYSEKSHALNQLYISQMNQLASIAWSAGGETALRKIRTFDHYFRLLDAQQLIENHCGSGKSYMMIDAKNRLYVCPWEAGNKEDIVGENTTLDHSKLAKYSKSLVELNNCSECWAKNLCGGGCMYIHKLNTGDKHTKDSNFCFRTRSLIITSILYYKISRELES